MAKLAQGKDARVSVGLVLLSMIILVLGGQSLASMSDPFPPARNAR